MRWLTNNVGSGPYIEVSELELPPDCEIIDVRDLVDKSGNQKESILKKIALGIELLRNGKKVIVCCDYGMSRSNSIAIGLIKTWENRTFSSVVNSVRSLVDENGIKIEVLGAVFNALADTEVKKNEQEVVITGGSGFLGKELTRHLKNDFTVNSPSSKDINLLNDAISFDLLIKEKTPKTIVHLANPRIFTTNVSLADSLLMLKNVLDVCRTNNTRLIYLSGWEIYSGYENVSLIADENCPANPKGTYGETKWLCELLIKQYVANYDLKCQILRSGPIYGLGTEKPKFIYNFIDKALKNEEIVTHKYLNGYPGLDLLHVSDLVIAIKKMIGNENVGDINIGSGNLITTNEIAKKIRDFYGSKSIISHSKINDHVSNVIMDSSKASALLDWRPQVSFDEGIRILMESKKINNKYE